MLFKLTVSVCGQKNWSIMKDKIRLNKYIAACGIASRRKADELIEQGLVKVNGNIVSELGFPVCDSDKIVISGELIRPEKKVYIKYYKPAGYITTMNDEKGRKTIYDILPDEIKNLKPVGRLDKDSTGLLILTNDGELINQMTHPSIKISKIYRVVVKGKIGQKYLQQLSDGLEIEKGKIAYADAKIVEFEGQNTVLEVVLFQGMNRQIRKMCDMIGFPVIHLKRVMHGTIDLSGIKKGQFKYLKPKQITELKAYIKKVYKLSKTD